MNEWNILPSLSSQRTSNPIRQIVEQIHISNEHNRTLIDLSLGDPTSFGNFRPSSNTINSVTQCLESNKYNGYQPSTGFSEAKKSIAKAYTYQSTETSANDVIITCGASGAINLSFQVLANPGDNILIPSPGFPLYKTICDKEAIEARCYKLIPEKGWQVDLNDLVSLITSRTKAILVNNPGNPTGSNYAEGHLKDILEIARRFRLPVISDEVYANMVFKGQTFYPLATLSEDVPIITIGGISKRYLVPGWRVGWIVINDKYNRLQSCRNAFQNLAQITLGAASIIQAAIPSIIDSKQSPLDRVMEMIESQAVYLTNYINEHCNGLQAIQPQGSIFVMVSITFGRFIGIDSDQEFVKQLLKEEMVLVLPGSCFMANGFIRLVTCAPSEVLQEACKRIQAFCMRHSK